MANGIKSLLLLLFTLGLFGCQKWTHDIVMIDDPEEGPAYTVGVDYNRSPATNG